MKANLLIAGIGLAAMAVLLVCGILLYQRSFLVVAWEYRVCFVQGSRVTFANGVWQGRIPMEPADPKSSLDSCPGKWEYLEAAGSEGWELVSVAPLVDIKDQQAQELYLRRARK